MWCLHRLSSLLLVVRHCLSPACSLPFFAKTVPFLVALLQWGSAVPGASHLDGSYDNRCALPPKTPLSYISLSLSLCSLSLLSPLLSVLSPCLLNSFELHQPWCFGMSCCADVGFRGTRDSFIVADPTEAWVLETAGRQWVARRVAPGQVSPGTQTQDTTLGVLYELV